MRIGINCLRVDPTSVGGINSYVMGLLEGFVATGTNHRVLLYTVRANQHLFESFRPCGSFNIVAVDDRFLEAKKTLCRAVLLCRSEKLYRVTSNVLFANLKRIMDAQTDIIYTPTTVLQWFNSCRPTVITMHDIQQVHYPEFFSWAVRLSRRITYGLTARYADYFQAISEFSKKDFLAHFRELSPRQFEVIPSGVNVEKFATPVTDDVCKRYGLPDRFLFFPAQLWPHKNHLTLLKALKQIETRHRIKIPLVLTGGMFPSTPKIFEFIADQSMDYVRYVGKVSTRELIALHQKATFMITSTLYEATSLPILEAAAAGTPVIASRIPPIEELAQVLQLNLFDPLDVDGLARLICRLWSNESEASAQVAINRQRIALHSWENTARKYLQFFERIVNS